MDGFPFELIIFLIIAAVSWLWGQRERLQSAAERRLEEQTMEAPPARPRPSRQARPAPAQVGTRSARRPPRSQERSLEEREWAARRPEPGPVLAAPRPVATPRVSLTRGNLRQAMVLHEILGPPRAMQPMAEPGAAQGARPR